MTDLTSLSGIKDLLVRYDLLPKKGFGQNFLTDRNILTKIIDSLQLNGNEYVVEIGPGLGVLTQALAAKAKGVLAIDADERLKPVLAETCADFTNLHVHFADVLKTDIETVLKNVFALDAVPEYLVCANIPYNITSPIIFKLLEDCPHLKSATLMMQKEVAERLVAPKDTKSYGRLTLTAGYYADTKRILNVSRGCFHPAPKVDSAVVCLTPKKELPLDHKMQKQLSGLFAAAFQQRRKAILKNFAGYFHCEKDEMEAVLTKLGLSAQSRPENLSLEDYIRLIQAFAVPQGSTE